MCFYISGGHFSCLKDKKAHTAKISYILGNRTKSFLFKLIVCYNYNKELFLILQCFFLYLTSFCFSSSVTVCIILDHIVTFFLFCFVRNTFISFPSVFLGYLFRILIIISCWIFRHFYICKKKKKIKKNY